MTLKRIVEMALENIGVLAEGAEASPGQIAGCLDYLNALLGAWSTERLLIPCESKITTTLPQQRTLTVGPGMDIDAESVPVDVVGVAVYFEGNTYRPYRAPESSLDAPATLINTIPGRYALSFGPDAVTLHLSATPPPACSIDLKVLYPFSSLVELTAELEFPAGYDQLLHSSLSVAIAPKYGKAVRQDVAAMAADAYRKLKHKHASERTPGEARMPAGLPGMNRIGYDITIGQ